MHKTKSVLLATLMLAAVVTPTASAGWLHFANAVVQAQAETEKHPTLLEQMVVLRKSVVRPNACVAYTNNVTKRGKGRIFTTLLARYPDGTEETTQFITSVKKNMGLNCKKIKRVVPAATEFLFVHGFRNFPRLRNRDGRIEFAEIASVISSAGVPMLGQDAPLGFVPAKGTAPYGLLPAHGSAWFHSARSIFQADEDNVKHPTDLTRTILVPIERRGATLCAAYSNMAEDPNRGKVVVTARITKLDGSVQRLKFAGGIRDNQFLRCKQAPSRLMPGEFVDFVFELKNLAKLPVEDDFVGFANLSGVLVSSGDPAFREPPPPPAPPEPDPEPPTPTPEPTPTPPPPTPTPPPAPTPPPSGGGISEADQRAVSKLMATQPVQLWRSKNNSPAKWQVVGPKTRAVPGTNQLILSTAGVGSTPAQAVADYERKMGSLGPPGGLLSAADRNLLQWYANINTSGGPTSVRKAGNGGYYGEYYRPGKGVQHEGPFGSFGAALNWLRSQGL